MTLERPPLPAFAALKNFRKTGDCTWTRAGLPSLWAHAPKPVPGSISDIGPKPAISTPTVAGSDGQAQSAPQNATQNAATEPAAPPAEGSPGIAQPQASATQEAAPNQPQNGGDANQPGASTVKAPVGSEVRSPVDSSPTNRDTQQTTSEAKQGQPPNTDSGVMDKNANPSDDPPLSLNKQEDLKKQELRDLTGKGTPEELETKRAELQDLMEKNGTATVWPGNHNKINSKFGPREDPNHPGSEEFHPGLDIKNEVGDPVLASDSGTVTNVRPCSGGETRVEITHRDGSKSTYLHTTPSESMKVGDYVIAGDTIGITDLSGHSTGGHIHYEYRTPDGTRVDPMPHLTHRQGT